MSLNKILHKLNPMLLKYPNTNMTYQEVLQIELVRFKKILEKYINNYYNSYIPSVYERGKNKGNLKYSLDLDKICEISSTGKLITCRILINENTIHESIITGNNSNALWLINDGWQVKKNVWFKNIYRFGYYEGAHFIEDAIKEFESTTKYNIKVQVIKPLLYY